MKREHQKSENAHQIKPPSNDRAQERPLQGRCPKGNLKQSIPLGTVVMTRGASDAFVESGADVLPFLIRHSAGDWGDVTKADKRENDLSVEQGDRLLSAYQLPGTGVKIWVITEADRSATTLLLPEEY